MEHAVSIFGLKGTAIILTDRDGIHVPTSVNKIIQSYPYTTQAMVDSHCEILWDDNSGASLGFQTTENYRAGLDNPKNHAVIAQN